MFYCDEGMDKYQARAILFNGMITHSSVVNLKESTPISAGFCSIVMKVSTGKMGIECWGKSTSLEIESEKSFDQEIIARTLTRKHPYI